MAPDGGLLHLVELAGGSGPRRLASSVASDRRVRGADGPRAGR
jgi:hypothetical protein